MLKIKKSVVEIQFSDLVWHSMERLAAHLARIQSLLIPDAAVFTGYNTIID